jgi:hypothetical protein
MNLPSINDTERILPNSSDAKCYRFRRHILYVCLWGIPFFIAMGVGSACMALFSKDSPYPITSAAFFMLFWSFWTVLGIFGLFQYFRSRLFLSETHVEYVGVFKSKLMALDEMARVVWRTQPTGGSIVLRASNRKIVIELYNYDKDQRNELINFFRENTNHEIQNGWDRFSQYFIKQKELSKGTALFLSMLLSVFGVLFIYIWMADFGNQNLIFGIVNLLVALWPLWLIKKSKKNKEMAVS